MKKKTANKKILKRLWLLLCLPVAFLLTFAAMKSDKFAQWYATTVYPVLSRAVNFITSLVPISVAEILIILLILGILFYFIFYIRKIIKEKGSRKSNLFKFFLNLACAISVIGLAYVLTCGINYYRYSFAQVSGLTVKESSKSELNALCSELAEKTSSLRTKVKTDKNGVMKLSSANIYETAAQAKDAYSKMEALYPTLKSGYGAPKPVLCSKLMSYGNITGIFVPFTFEANINTDVPAYSIPASMCHELSHLRGYMREDEANFIAYLTCERSGNPDFEYSGDMLAFVLANNALFGVDQTAGSKNYSRLSDGVKHDFEANNTYWKQFEGPVAKVSQKVNDSYLKANSQDDGIKSYGRMVDLLLADYRKRHNLK